MENQEFYTIAHAALLTCIETIKPLDTHSRNNKHRREFVEQLKTTLHWYLGKSAYALPFIPVAPYTPTTGVYYITRENTEVLDAPVTIPKPLEPLMLEPLESFESLATEAPDTSESITTNTTDTLDVHEKLREFLQTEITTQLHLDKLVIEQNTLNNELYSVAILVTDKQKESTEWLGITNDTISEINNAVKQQTHIVKKLKILDAQIIKIHNDLTQINTQITLTRTDIIT